MSRRAGATTFATFAILAEVILAGVSCGGGAAPAAHPAPDAGGGGPPATGPTGATTSDAATSLDALAARGPTDAPLMREILRVERAAPSAALPRAERDICVRAIFAASREVRVWFADESGTMRGEPATGASGTVPPRGPACAKKGETLRLVIDKSGDKTSDKNEPALADTSARAVIFAAP